MSKKDERLNKIISIVKIKNGSSIKDLANSLGVSEMTVRRDIKILEENNIIEVYHGAVVYKPSYDNPVEDENSIYDLNLNSQLMNKQKDIIGEYAARLIEKDDAVIIDTGTTTEKLSKHMGSDLKCKALVFSSNNFLNLMMKPNIEVVLAGGVYHRDTGMFESVSALDLIKNTRANKVFLSAAGVHKDLGVTCANSYELLHKKMIIKNSLEVILLIDSSKFGSVKAIHFCDLSDIDTIITDDNISEDWINYLKELEIEVIIAK